MEQPLVSVLMTAYNREKYIGEAIESVLASDYKNFELIIVDDCSSDATVAIAQVYALKDPRIKLYINEKNLGDYPNRNQAAFYAIGKYIKYLDSDDIMYPHCLTVMVNAMECFPEAGYGLSSVSDVLHPYPFELSPREAYKENFNGYGHFDRAPGSAIILKSAFEKVGGFSGKRMIGDYELWLTLSRYYKLLKLPRDLVWDRVHAGQESKTDYANAYTQLRKQILHEALFHPDCPLNTLEVKHILKQINKRVLKKWLFNLIQKNTGRKD